MTRSVRTLLSLLLLGTTAAGPAMAGVPAAQPSPPPAVAAPLPAPAPSPAPLPAAAPRAPRAAATPLAPAAAAAAAPVAPVAAPAAAPAPAEVRRQAITLQAGTGILLPLPQPAATIMSAEPAVARVQPASPTSLFLMGAGAGHTTVIATAANGAAIVQYDVTVIAPPPAREPQWEAPAPGGGGGGGDESGAISRETVAAIRSAIHRLVPGGYAVEASGAGERVVLTGTVATPAVAQQVEAIARGYAGEKSTIVLDLVVLSSIQVNVRVRIAEISRTITRELGFNWQALGAEANKWRFGLLTGAAASATSAATFSPLTPLGLASSPNQLGAGFTSGKWDVNGIIDALATDQLITILAEPNLTAQSGEPASFLAGGEFPIPVAGNTSNGTTTITIVFKQFGISLEVVPTVLSAGRLNLRVRPEVSELSTTGAVSVPIAGGTLTIPALAVRRAETTVELGSGQSFAIAGLLQKTSTDTTNTVPGIGEVPVLGALFRSTNFQRGESELVIIVTPYLVKPAASPAAFRLPTDGFRPATDLDRLLLGHQLAPQPGQPPLDAGFILK